MRVRIVFAASAAALAVACQAQVWEKPIVPGVTYRMEVDLSVPRIVHAVRYSLGATGVTMKSELAGGTVIEENATKGRETVSEMAARTGSILAVNGDFFPFTGDPLGVMLRDGQLLSSPGRGRSAFGWGQNASIAGLVDFKATAELAGRTLDIDGINEEGGLNKAVLHTSVASFALAKTPNIQAVFKMENEDWAPNSTISGTFEGLYADIPKMPIQPGNAVLSVSGERAEAVRMLIPGERVRFKFEATGFDWTKVDQVMGGGPTLVREGKIFVDASRQGFNDAFTNKRHPRTAMGRTSSGDIWIAVIDGRQKMSDGATLPETALIMQRLGCVDAVNLDGGGSSAINVLGLTLNRPSDGKERPVANGVIVLGERPSGPNATYSIRLPDKMIAGIPRGLAVLDSAGKEIPHLEVLWSAQGTSWIDQGGLLRPVAKGATTVSAYVRGQILRASFEVLEAEKPPTKSKPRVAPKPSRGKKGRG